MSHKHVDNLAEMIKAKRAGKGDSVQESVENVKGVVYRKPLQKSTERAHAVEQLHFSFFPEDLGRDPVQSLKPGADRLTVDQWKAFVRARAITLVPPARA